MRAAERRERLVVGGLELERSASLPLVDGCEVEAAAVWGLPLELAWPIAVVEFMDLW